MSNKYIDSDIVINRTIIREATLRMRQDIDSGNFSKEKKEKNDFINIPFFRIINWLVLNSDVFATFLLFMVKRTIRKENKKQIVEPKGYTLLKLTNILFSAKTREQVFLPIMADWDEEIFEVLEKDKDVKLLLFMINVRYTCSFLSAMCQKSPIGDLIEFIMKVAK